MLIKLVGLGVTVILVAIISWILRKQKHIPVKFGVAGLTLILMPSVYHSIVFSEDRLYFGLSALAAVIGLFLFTQDIPKTDN